LPKESSKLGTREQGQGTGEAETISSLVPIPSSLNLMSREFNELVAVMERLRAPGGCPWDREQTYASLAQYLLEETYETFEAIQEADQTGDTTNLREELGDILLQVVFHSTIAAEKGDFTIDQLIKGVTEKLILRHPHVFGEKELATAADVLNNWDELKAHERQKSGKVEKEKESILDDVTVHFPALLEALKLTKKAAKVGFDWESAAHVFDKLNEELDELNAAISNDDQSKIEEEIGDLLFVVVNLARKLDVEPETALKRTNHKFRERFKFIERELKERGRTPEQSNLEEMDALWNAAKKQPRPQPKIEKLDIFFDE
jgi:MazG family protein